MSAAIRMIPGLIKPLKYILRRLPPGGIEAPNDNGERERRHRRRRRRAIRLRM